MGVGFGLGGAFVCLSFVVGLIGWSLIVRRLKWAIEMARQTVEQMGRAKSRSFCWLPILYRGAYARSCIFSDHGLGRRMN